MDGPGPSMDGPVPFMYGPGPSMDGPGPSMLTLVFWLEYRCSRLCFGFKIDAHVRVLVSKSMLSLVFWRETTRGVAIFMAEWGLRHRATRHQLTGRTSRGGQGGQAFLIWYLERKDLVCFLLTEASTHPEARGFGGLLFFQRYFNRNNSFKVANQISNSTYRPLFAM